MHCDTVTPPQKTVFAVFGKVAYESPGSNCSIFFIRATPLIRAIETYRCHLALKLNFYHVERRRLSQRKNWLGGVASRSVGEKNKESHKHRIFHIFTQKPPLLRSSPNLFWELISTDKMPPDKMPPGKLTAGQNATGKRNC